MKKLLIVESPTKAKTINKFLGQDYKVVSSFGHIRDLPAKEMGVDIEHDFKPKYVIPTKAKTTVTMLKKEAAKADEIYYATDKDREGEAIAWHLHYILKDKKHKFHRVGFHEITKSAVGQALKETRDIDQNLVDAQQGRRILDRLVGYELSPFLWKKVAKGLSAGRVQSVAVRLIVEREREIQKFKKDEYWSIEALLKIEKLKETKEFLSNLYKIDNKKLDKLDIKNKKSADKILADLKDAKYVVEDLTKRTTKRKPPAPFTTSTLQQEGNHKLHFSSKQTMFMAQSLYEGVELGKHGATGLITYMRTDSTNLADGFLNDTQKYVKQEFGAKYSLSEPRKHKTKSKSAQEAHEAIRPTDINRTPEDVKPFLKDNQFKLYELIWKRTLACQMAEAEMNAVTADIQATKKYIFRATGSTIKFDGWLKVYPGSVSENLLPELSKGDELDLKKLESKQHFTEPPARYSEATLVKKMEELGIGRPSTYAPTISTIEDRGYIRKQDKRLSPTDIAFVVSDLLVKHFKEVVDYEFTAKMEDDLDDIANGKIKWVPVVREFYQPFKNNLMNKYNEVKKDDLINEATDEKCEKCGEPMVIKTGRFGRFLACTGFPKCKNTKNLASDNDGGSAEKSESGEVVEKKEPEKSDQVCEKCGEPMLIREGKFGKFLACSGFPKCKNTKPLDFGTGVKCPECTKGEMVARRTRSRRTFYACNRYPDCKFAVWSKPVTDPEKEGQGMKCSKCKSLIVMGAKGKVKCSKKGCDFEKEMEVQE